MGIKNTNNSITWGEGRKLRQPHFVCTHCAIEFEGVSPMNATCPQCQETYGHFHTQLIRCGTLALAYWYEANPDIKITRYVPEN